VRLPHPASVLLSTPRGSAARRPPSARSRGSDGFAVVVGGQHGVKGPVGSEPSPDARRHAAAGKQQGRPGPRPRSPRCLPRPRCGPATRRARGRFPARVRTWSRTRRAASRPEHPAVGPAPPASPEPVGVPGHRPQSHQVRAAIEEPSDLQVTRQVSRGGDRNRTGVQGFAAPCLVARNTWSTGMNSRRHPRLGRGLVPVQHGHRC
jgi:hypothetical protein